MTWVRSAFCSDNACVEVARDGGGVLVRNSDDIDTTVRFSLEEWRDFLRGVRETAVNERDK